MDFDYIGAFACIGHGHQDHISQAKRLCNAGIDVYASSATISGHGHESHRMKTIEVGDQIKVGDFKIKAFNLKHDVPCLGFMGDHPESGRFVYISDTYYVPYKFPDVVHYLVECNFDEDVLAERISVGSIHYSLRDRVFQSHMSLQTLLQMLKNNDLTKVRTICLLHLSEQNSNAKRMLEEVKKVAPFADVYIAEKGLTINLDKIPF